jgi:hypothetical protein
MYSYTPTEALLNMFEKDVEVEALEKADTRIRVTIGAHQETAKGAEFVEWSGNEVCGASSPPRGTE